MEEICLKFKGDAEEFGRDVWDKSEYRRYRVGIKEDVRMIRSTRYRWCIKGFLGYQLTIYQLLDHL